MVHHIVSHLVRRGVEELTVRQQYIEKLNNDAQAYEDAGPEMEVKPYEMLPILITLVIGMLVVLSVS